MKLKIKSLFHLIKQIINGYWKLVFNDEKTELRALARKRIINDLCKCKKYYIDFKLPLLKKRVKLFAYCKECGCIIEAKVRCKDCICPKGKWKNYK